MYARKWPLPLCVYSVFCMLCKRMVSSPFFRMVYSPFFRMVYSPISEWCTLPFSEWCTHPFSEWCTLPFSEWCTHPSSGILLLSSHAVFCSGVEYSWIRAIILYNLNTFLRCTEVLNSGAVPGTLFIYFVIYLTIHSLFFLGMFSCWIFFLFELGKWWLLHLGIIFFLLGRGNRNSWVAVQWPSALTT